MNEGAIRTDPLLFRYSFRAYSSESPQKGNVIPEPEKSAIRPAGLPENSTVTPIVFVVDDDISVRESLELLIRSEGWKPETFACAQEFLNHPRTLVPSCLVLDLSLPGLNGLDLQKHLAMEHINIPIIFITAYGDVRKSVQAMRAGAFEFLTKPLDNETLVSAIRKALERSRLALAENAEMQELRFRYASLTPREHQVMALVLSGLLNKQVGSELGISEITVKAHRRQVMQKMKANSLADLVRMAEKLRLESPLISVKFAAGSGLHSVGPAS
jgi:FixJ family two-component response regulator